MSKAGDRNKALMEAFMDACFGKAPTTCAMTITVPDGRIFEFDAIPSGITREQGDLIGFTLTVRSTRRLEMKR